MKENDGISVIGLGKLGACLAAALAYKGFDVLGLDVDQKIVNQINKGQAPVAEPNLQEIMDRAKNKLKATNNFKKLIDNSNISFIVVPTPSEEGGSFSNKFLEIVLKEMAGHIRNKKSHHMIVVNSTVMPTTMEMILVPFIEKYSGKKVNDGWSVCYNPEFIALGDVVNGILKPDVVLIGENNEEAGKKLEKVYRKLCDNNPPISRMSLVSAEITKIALNAFITMKISFANTLGNICERVKGADADSISQALGADRRISPHFIKAGLPFGGPCFPRDNRAFEVFAKQVGVDAVLSRATDKVNNSHTDNLFKKIREVVKLSKYDSMSILGLAYKTKTYVIEESAIIRVIDNLLRRDGMMKINVYDPMAMESVREIFGNRIAYAESAKHCVSQSPFWIIASPEDEFKEINVRDIWRDPTTIIDCWRLLDQKKFEKRAQYLSLGGNYYEDN